MIPMADPIYHPFEDKIIGYVFTELSTTTITDPIIENIPEGSTDLYFRIDNHLYKYSNNALEPCRDSFTLIDDMGQYALNDKTKITRMYNNETSEIVFLISRPLEIDGWYITECVSTDVYSKTMQKSFKNTFIMILLAALFITVVLYLFLYHTVSVPVSKLQKRIKKIEKGDFSRDPSTEWNHELVQTMVEQRSKTKRRRTNMNIRCSKAR